jgi:hypothetical protein
MKRLLGLLTTRTTAMRFTLFVLTGACAMAAREQAEASALGRTPPGQCLPADSVTTQTSPLLDSIANGLTVEMRATRDSLGLPATSNVRSSVVTQNTTCTKAASTIDSIAGTPPSGRRVYVYKLGKFYAVEDPNRTAGGWRQIAFFSSSFAYQGSLAQ